ncbi:hypothetical protein DM01DRAFT_1315161 [Hesseltinella vesiculosa]|uniref:Dynactin subunit 2 n=1 Tax=Hesseltinella vesiculosa TaxID=101127 RepID=A0A1X2GV53_9FUNG|nr:hypothetical protein DM01DRAFT_1315161 [Hesseltinella vesiculosa]
MSKYAALPDIDDQPDVYETDDVTVDKTATVHNDDDESSDDNENVVRSRVSIKDASSRFQDSVVDASQSDFSDRLNRRKKAMYRTFVRRPPALETSEYEILPKDMVLEETRLQKLRRLMYEVQQLNQELESDQGNEDKDKDISQADLLAQITYLQSDLTRMGERMGQAETNGNNTYGKNVEEAKALIKQLESYKAMAAANTQEDQTSPQPEAVVKDGITYELFYTPETIRAQKQTNTADIDERIARLEKLVGTSAGQDFESLPGNIASMSFIHSLSKLEQQMSLLAQPRHLDTISRRIKVLIPELERLHELKTGNRKDHAFGLAGLSTTTTTTTILANTVNGDRKDEQPNISNDMEEKINKLFTTMEKVDPLLNLTPALLTRLKALQGLHSEAAIFSRTLKVISEEQTRMADELKNLDVTSQTLTSSFEENRELLEKNVTVIDTRISDLVQRMEALTSKASA